MESKSAERPASSKVSSFTPFYRIENDIDYMDKIEQTKPTGEIKAIFSIKENSNLAGVEFFKENNKTDWVI